MTLHGRGESPRADRVGPLPDVRGDGHFSGMFTADVCRYLVDHLTPDELQPLLDRAGETRPFDRLLDRGTWSSYAQFRSLFEAVAAALPGRETWPAVAMHAIRGNTGPGLAEAAQAFGSPAALYAAVPAATSNLGSTTTLEVEELGPREWVAHVRFRDGFAPFTAFCGYVAALLSAMPTLFGYGAATVVEETCQCQGAPACRLRIAWEDRDEADRQLELMAIRNGLLERRLLELQQVVTDVVCGQDTDEVLRGILAHAAHCVVAPVAVLAIREPARPRVFSLGVDEAEAERLAQELLSDPAPEDDGMLVVDVATARRSYGRLAVIDPGARYFTKAPGDVAVCGRLAAAHLETVEATRESRRQAATAHSLLELANALAEIVSPDEMAGKLARALGDVIDCDRAAVLLVDGGPRLAAAHGHDDTAVAALCSPSFMAAVASHRDREPAALHPDRHGAPDVGACVVVPLVNQRETLGWIVVDEPDHSSGLTGAESFDDRLRAMASQAATAITNAVLIEQVRHQALHDSLTGLANRTLIIDRAEQMLVRARRQQQACAALFIDLDGFKQVNDSRGHAAGDVLLKSVAERLRAAVRDSDTVGRLGGDEFVVLVDGSSPDASPALLAERLLDVLSAPFDLAPPLELTASIGIAVGDRDGAGELLRDADIALYEAKGAGKHRYVVFEPEMRLAA